MSQTLTNTKSVILLTKIPKKKEPNLFEKKDSLENKKIYQIKPGMI